MINKPKTKYCHNFMIDKDVYQGLKEYSQTSMIPMSKIVNQLLKEYLTSKLNDNK